MVDALFGDLDEAGLADFQAHLEVCSGCAQSFQGMQNTLQITAQVKEPEMPAAYWDSYYDRLEQRMQAEQQTEKLASEPVRKEASESVLHRIKLHRIKELFWPSQLAWQGAFAVALVLIGVFIGRLWEGGNQVLLPGDSLSVAVNPDGANLGPARLTPAQLNLETQQYLDRSRMLLLGLVNFEADEDALSILNMPRQQQVAGELAAQSAPLQDALTDNNEQQLSALIEELQGILLQIANLEAQEDLPSIELIQRGVDQSAILLKINLEKMKLSDQTQSSDQKQKTEKPANSRQRADTETI